MGVMTITISDTPLHPLARNVWPGQLGDELHRRICLSIVHPSLREIAAKTLEGITRVSGDDLEDVKAIQRVTGRPLMRVLAREGDRMVEWDESLNLGMGGASSVAWDLAKFSQGILIEKLYAERLERLGGALVTQFSTGSPSGPWNLKDLRVNGNDLGGFLRKIGVENPEWWFARQVGVRLSPEWLETASFSVYPRPEVDTRSWALKPVQRYSKDLPPSLGRLFYERYKGLIKSILFKQLGSNANAVSKSKRDDAFQEGIIYALRGYEAFEEGKGFQPSTYLGDWIWAGIRLSLDGSGLSFEAKKQIKELEAKEESYRRAGGWPTEEALAESLGWSLATLQRVQKKRELARPLCLDAPIGDGRKTLRGVIEQSLGRTDEEEWEPILLEKLRAALEQGVLRPGDQEIIELMFGLKDGREWSSEEIARQRGVKGQGIREKKKRALNELKAALTSSLQ